MCISTRSEALYMTQYTRHMNTEQTNNKHQGSVHPNHQGTRHIVIEALRNPSGKCPSKGFLVI